MSLERGGTGLSGEHQWSQIQHEGEWVPTDGSVGLLEGGGIGSTIKHSGAIESLLVIEQQSLRHSGVESLPVCTVHSQGPRLISGGRK